MGVRVKARWFKKAQAHGPKEVASVVAVAVWKAATNGLKTLRDAKFTVDVGMPFIVVHGEFLAFLTVVADRLAYRQDHGDWRQEFTVALVTRLSELVDENLNDLIGRDIVRSHKDRFIDLVNARMAEYAEFDYTSAGPDFGFLRYFGHCVEVALTDESDRRWALDQIMSSQAPAAVEIVERTMRGVLGIETPPEYDLNAVAGNSLR